MLQAGWQGMILDLFSFKKVDFPFQLSLRGDLLGPHRGGAISHSGCLWKLRASAYILRIQTASFQEVFTHMCIFLSSFGALSEKAKTT